MTPEELEAVGELAGTAVAGVALQAQGLHEAVAGRVWGGVGPAATPVRVVHDRIAAAVYGGLRRSLTAGARAGVRALSATSPSESSVLQRSSAARIAVGVLNGAFGDALARQGNALALGMSVHPPLSSLTRATGRLAVFVHGLCETDDAWRLAADRHVPYGPRLEAELGYTPLYIRYNTGRHISENGRTLAEVLAEVVADWPMPVYEIVLVGHSMGGLVARSACHYGASSGWPAKVRHVFTLSAPHRGAPLERAANAAAFGFARIAETRGIARALNLRSAGVKDLRYGYLLDEDWFEHDADAFLRNTGREVPFLPTANHYFIGASLRGPLGRVVGDLLVLRASAWASRGQQTEFPLENYAHFEGLNHFALLNHPAVYDVIRRCLAGRPALEPAPSAE